MKKIALILIIMSLLVCISAVEKIKPFTLEDLSGAKVKSADLLAKGPIVIDFWASFCSPCLKALPEFDKIQKKYKNDITIVAVCADIPKNKDKAKSIIKSQKFSFVTLFDDAKDLQKMLNVTELPRTFLVNEKGEIVYEHSGYIKGDEKKLEEAIIKLLKK